MSDDYFDNDGSKEESSMPAEREDKGEQDGSENEGDSKTFLINSAVCPDLKPGDILKLRVTAVHGEEYETEYVHDDNDNDNDEESESGEQSPEQESMPGSSEGGGQMSSLMD